MNSGSLLRALGVLVLSVGLVGHVLFWNYVPLRVGLIVVASFGAWLISPVLAAQRDRSALHKVKIGRFCSEISCLSLDIQ